jgi:hypothetical protein
MNRKTLLIILAIVAALCICCAVVALVLVTQTGRLVGQTFSTDADKTTEVAQAITDYTLPPRFEPAGSMNLLGISMAIFTTSDQSMTMMLFQFPPSAGLTQEQMEEQMQQFSSQRTGSNLTMERVDSRPVRIRGKISDLTTLEGTDEDGNRMRQQIAVFDGKNGTSFFMALGAIDAWDQVAINHFIASFK